MDGGLQGAASAFWSTASQGEVVSFFRHLGEDVSELDGAVLQVAGRLAFEHLPWLSDHALARHLGGESFPFVSPPLWDSQRFLQRADLPAAAEQASTGLCHLSQAVATTLAWPTGLAKVVFSGLRRAAGGLLARCGGLGAGRGGHQQPDRKISSEGPLAKALRATASNRCWPPSTVAGCWLVGPTHLKSGLGTPYFDTTLLSVFFSFF